MFFDDRRDAGHRLAAQLLHLAADDPVVIALPRGGVPVAVEIAHALRAPLELLTVRKLGAPGQPELGIGAVAEDGAGVLDAAGARAAGMTREQFEQTLAAESRELRRRVSVYRDGRPALDVRGRTVIVVDDGAATGLTDLAAVRALRGRGAARIIAALPVASTDAVALIGDEADDVICHLTPEHLRSVGLWYHDFEQVGDDEVRSLLAGASHPERWGDADHSQALRIPLGDAELHGSLVLPARARGLVLFADGSGSSRHNARNRAVARTLHASGFGTLLSDLLSEQEEADRRDVATDIRFLTGRLLAVTRWVATHPPTRGLPLGYLGASTGATAALRAAAELGDGIGAVVSRGGRPDLAADRLPEVTAPTLLVVGGRDAEVLELNRQAAGRMRAPCSLTVVEGAGHLFAEPGTLKKASRLAAGWFTKHLGADVPAGVGTEATQ